MSGIETNNSFCVCVWVWVCVCVCVWEGRGVDRLFKNLSLSLSLQTKECF